jgi:single-strand DNA-binding protein
MLNHVVLVGRLTADPSLRYTKNGKAVAVFTIAVNRNKEQTDFIRITAFNKTAENVANYLQKGSLVAIDGTIVTGSYEKNGQRIYTTDIWANTVQFLESKGKGTGEQKERNTGQNQAPASVYGVTDPLTGENGGYADPFADSSIPIDDRDLPF